MFDAVDSMFIHMRCQNISYYTEDEKIRQIGRSSLKNNSDLK